MPAEEGWRRLWVPSVVQPGGADCARCFGGRSKRACVKRLLRAAGPPRGRTAGPGEGSRGSSDDRPFLRLSTTPSPSLPLARLSCCPQLSSNADRKTRRTDPSRRSTRARAPSPLPDQAPPTWHQPALDAFPLCLAISTPCLLYLRSSSSSRFGQGRYRSTISPSPLASRPTHTRQPRPSRLVPRAGKHDTRRRRPAFEPTVFLHLHLNISLG